MIVLSLFDGISCGQIALDRAGIKVERYFASEIKQHAIDVTKQNFPSTIHIGDVTKVSFNNGMLNTENGNFNVGKIDILIGGSPCQDFSAAKVHNGQLGLDGDKSKLFYEYLRILKEVNPKYFLLENVRMKKEYKEQLDTYLGVEGVYIDSKLVSFQTRARFYWTNIPNITQPNDRNISFQDFKDNNIDNIQEQGVIPNKTPSRLRMWNYGNGHEVGKPSSCKNITNSDKIGCVTRKQDRAPNSGMIEYNGWCRYLTNKELEAAQTVPVGYTNGLTRSQVEDVLGDGWTVDVIVHILSFIPKTREEDTISYKTIDYADQSPIETFNIGRDKINSARKGHEKKRVERLRGGDAGCMLPSGDVLGVSIFKSIARYMGYQLPVSEMSMDCFEGGFAVEREFEEKFKAAGKEFKAELDFLLRDKILGKDFVGSPDCIPGRYEGSNFIPEYGIEHKSCLSIGTAAKVYLDKQPKDEALIQAANYMNRFNLPWVLVYSNSAHYKTDHFIKRKHKGVEKVLPQKIEFKLKLVKGRVYYQHPETKEDIRTRITTEGIQMYYEGIIEAVVDKDISWLKMSQEDMLGNPGFFDPNLYDPFQLCYPVDKAIGKGFDEWVSIVKGMCETGYYLGTKKIDKKQTFMVKKDEEVIEQTVDLSEARSMLLGYLGGRV